MKRKVLWLLTMAVLCLVIVIIVDARLSGTTSVIMGGATGAFVESDSVTLSATNVEATPEPTADIWPAFTLDDFENLDYLSIVNGDNLVTSAFEPDCTPIEGTTWMLFNVAYVEHINDMLRDCRAAGNNVIIAGAYRSYSYQTKLFNSKASQIAYGYGVYDYNDPLYQKAAEEAKSIVMYPGSSEHQLGLAVDLMDKERTYLDYNQMNQELFAWLDEHCAEYGFIKRYPTRKMLLTGWDEPWHYRYVGVEAATFIMDNDLCYEEFYAHYHPDFTY